MYFPYLRGKLYELIALREISDLIQQNKQLISPIIEPVKILSSTDKVFPTLRNLLQDFRQKRINFNFIINPNVVDNIDTYAVLELLKNLMNGKSHYQLALIIDSKFSLEGSLNLLKQIDFEYNGLTLIHNHSSDSPQEIIDSISSITDIVYNIVNFSHTNRRYYRNFAKETLVSLDDYFNTLPKNADYLLQNESTFSEEYLLYKEDGFTGFSDFLTIGDVFVEGGFLPYAVAIHISYVEKDKIKIKHFVSDSNEDTSDVAGKFAEARDKLVYWCNKNNLDSHAIREFKRLQETGHFPGLGSIKKLSIMHHIELVINLLKQ